MEDQWASLSEPEGRVLAHPEWADTECKHLAPLVLGSRAETPNRSYSKQKNPVSKIPSGSYRFLASWIRAQVSLPK